MKRWSFGALLAAVALCGACAVTDYPVIFDARGADSGVGQSFYDKAYILPTSQVATLWDDGSDELYSSVTQDWRGDQWIYTYNNFDATAAVMLLDQTYCDPTRQGDCAIVTAWNPDLPNAYPHGDQGSGYNNVDDVFDYVPGADCSGYRSLSMLTTFPQRIGECGSGIWADKQGAAYEFGQLSRADFRGKEYYHLPIDNSIASFAVTGEDGFRTTMPVFGRYNGYIDEQLRLVLPMSPNVRFQLRWLDGFVKAHGSYIDVNATYGALTANFKINVTTVQNALERL